MTLNLEETTAIHNRDSMVKGFDQETDYNKIEETAKTIFDMNEQIYGEFDYFRGYIENDLHSTWKAPSVVIALGSFEKLKNDYVEQLHDNFRANANYLFIDVIENHRKAEQDNCSNAAKIN